MTLLLFSEAFRSLSAGERRASSYASLRAGSRLSRFPAGVERCFSKQRNVSNSHAFLVKDELAYCKGVISVIEKEPQITQISAVKEKLNVLKEVVEDFQEHLNYSSDADARKGHKTVESSFFGYKTHIAMSDERIITAAVITTGKKSTQAGMKINTVIGDTAYSEKANIEYTKEEKIALVAKLNPILTQGPRKEEDKLEFNKDAGMFVCKAGHLATRKARTGKLHNLQ